LLIALVAGLGTILLVTRWTNPPPVAAKSHPVVVAARPLAPGDTLDARSLEVKQSARRPEGSFAGKEELQQWEVAAPIKEGEIILKAALRPKGQGLAGRVDPGKRAMTVKVDEVTGVAGFPSPGDRVDVVFTSKPGEVKSGRSEVVLQNLKVLGCGSILEKRTGDKPQPATTVTLEVSPSEAEHLALALHEGHITLALRNQDDQGKVATSGVNLPDLLGKTAMVAPTPPRRVPNVEVIRRLKVQQESFPAPSGSKAPGKLSGG
jgi:pilus assembly protein CpaB